MQPQPDSLSNVAVPIIVALIGFAGVVISSIIASRGREGTPGAPAHPLISARLALWGSVAVTLAGLALLAVFVLPSGPDVAITYPAEGGVVGIREQVRGTSRRVPASREIWVVVYPEQVGRYYPQNAPAEVGAHGDWAALTIIGAPENSGERFGVLVVLADPAAQALFRTYIDAGKPAGSWPGLDALPAGAVIYDRVVVTRE